MAIYIHEDGSLRKSVSVTSRKNQRSVTSIRSNGTNTCDGAGDAGMLVVAGLGKAVSARLPSLDAQTNNRLHNVDVEFPEMSHPSNSGDVARDLRPQQLQAIAKPQPGTRCKPSRSDNAELLRDAAERRAVRCRTEEFRLQ